MKKFYLILNVFITFVLFNNRVFADTVIPNYVDNKINYSITCSTNNCYIEKKSYRSVFIYETDGQLHDYEFKYLSGGSSYRLSVGVTDVYPPFTGGVDSNVAFKIMQDYAPVINNTYTFSTDKKYILMTLTISVIDNDYGSVEWIGSSVSSDPSIPSVEIPDTDFYLFYDFATISDFDIFSDYDFSSFSDYEKVTITIIVNIFYLGFIGFCIYILAKGLYKMLSWVFR